jgi:cysteine synthase B
VSRERALLAAVGRTPLVELELPHELGRGARLFAKLESVNPGGSIKDRPVARMLMRALAAGKLSGGRRLLDASSGNAGIAYALFGAALRVPVTLVVPANASAERLARIEAHGAELHLTDPLEGYDAALREARRLARAEPGRYWHCDQYANEDNWRAHYEGTGAEILSQVRDLAGLVPDALVCGVGTGGTLTGVARRLREANPTLRVVTVIPEVFPGIEGLKPLGSPGDLAPPILDARLIHERVTMSLDQAAEAARTLAREGLFVGPSSGAHVRAALDPAARRGARVIVTILPDSGERYVSTGLWSRAPAHAALGF